MSASKELNIRQFEVDWYRKNGKHPERIKIDGEGKEYLVGDESFNRLKHIELVEMAIQCAIDAGVTYERQ